MQNSNSVEHIDMIYADDVNLMGKKTQKRKKTDTLVTH